MTGRKRRVGGDDAQLDLLLVKREPASRMRQADPITVRIPEAIRLTGIGRSKLYELIANRDVEIVKIGRCTLIPMASLHALIERAKSRQA
jgi:excisionase family DNA binding protein